MQEFVKDILLAVQQKGMATVCYLLFHLISFFVAVPFFDWLAKKMKIDRVRAFCALLVNCIVFLVLMYFIGWVEASLGLGSFGRKNVVTVYAWIPIICFLSARILKLDHTTLCTMMAPAMPLIQAVSRPGCLFAGCCKGFCWEWGIYNINTKDFRFPMPAVEMLWMVAVGLLVIYLLKKSGYKPLGWLYPFMLVVYGTLQFLFEFWIDNQKIVGKLSLRSFHELFLIVVGLVWLLCLYVLKKRRERAELLAAQPLPKKHKITAVIKK